jgi:predicted nucleic-acid-binding protein
MIGLDTNILTRFFAQDHPAQSRKADAILGSLTIDEPGWVSLASVLELVWVFTSNFRADRRGVCLVLDQLQRRKEIVIENADSFRQALDLYRHGNADFADCLISSLSLAAGCTKTLTFDKDAAKTAGMTLVA